MQIRLALASTAAILVAAACVYLVTRTPQAESPRMAAVDPPAADVELVGAPIEDPAADPTTGAARRIPIAEEPPARVAAARGANVLRVILEGITAQDARMATVKLTGVDEPHDGDKPHEGPEEVEASWPCQGLTSEFDLNPFLASVKRQGNLRAVELEVEVHHPHHIRETARVNLSSDVKHTNGKTFHEVRVRLARPEFWPEFTLAVRDAHTRAHLDDIELRFTPGNSNARWGWNATSNLLGDGLRSPIVLMGGRDVDEPEVTVAGLALLPPAGESPRFVELTGYRLPPDRGIGVTARAPGYAWGSIALDVSMGDEHELLLEPCARLGVRLANVQLERYAAQEMVAMLCVYWVREDGGNQYVRFARLDETLMTEGLRLDNLAPGGYRVVVELDGGLWRERPVLALEEVSLAVGETRELTLALADPPARRERTTLGGVVSLPAFGGEGEVKIHVYHESYRRHRKPDVEFALADLEPVGGTLPSWRFRVEDLPVGLYQIQILPFMKSWMIELPAGGREDVELVIPELAEVLVETVDARTGERVPIEEFFFSYEETLPGQLHNYWARTEFEEPGRFRFWTATGPASIWPGIPRELNYGRRWEDHQLVPGLQSLRFELEPVYAVRIEFREDGVLVDHLDPIWDEVKLTDNFRAVDHEGQRTGLSIKKEWIAQVSAPGVYEVTFEGVGADRFHPIPPQRVDARAGETAVVTVELSRK